MWEALSLPCPLCGHKGKRVAYIGWALYAVWKMYPKLPCEISLSVEKRLVYALLFQGNWKQQVPYGEDSGTNRGMPLVSIASCVREASTYPCQRHCCNNFRHFLSYLLTAVFYLIYKKGRKTNKLTVNDRCIRYEICEKSCPHQTITIQNGRLLGCSAMWALSCALTSLFQANQ